MYAESSLNAYRPHQTQEDTRRVTVKYNRVHLAVYSILSQHPSSKKYKYYLVSITSIRDVSVHVAYYFYIEVHS